MIDLITNTHSKLAGAVFFLSKYLCRMKRAPQNTRKKATWRKMSRVRQYPTFCQQVQPPGGFSPQQQLSIWQYMGWERRFQPTIVTNTYAPNTTTQYATCVNLSQIQLRHKSIMPTINGNHNDAMKAGYRQLDFPA